jgi:alpha,alpha-trehalase
MAGSQRAPSLAQTVLGPLLTRCVAFALLAICSCAGLGAGARVDSRTEDRAQRASGEKQAPSRIGLLQASPSEVYGELFTRVQLSRLFPDSKTFADASAKRDPREILARYRREGSQATFDLARFVESEFDLPRRPTSDFTSLPGRELDQHIAALWPILTRPADPAAAFYSSRLPLPRPYVVPGGRFDELYYWDSYFTMLGLAASGHHGAVRDLCENFVHLVERYGHVPNGNRSYYLSRSQPPFLASMMELVASHAGQKVWARFAPVLEREYRFWMDGSERVRKHSAFRRVVRLEDGTLLNRYWDDRDTPRDEAYLEDVETAQRSQRPPGEVYRNLRAAAESGWDFSSRWLLDPTRLDSIRTVDLVPIDLNAILYGVEVTLARVFESDAERSLLYRERAAARRAAVLRYLWHEELGAFTDLEWQSGVATRELTAAMVVPLFVGLVPQGLAERVAGTIEKRLLAPHGLVTSLTTSGQQWDAPNGWAPLVWMASTGLRRYGYKDLAQELERRFVARAMSEFRRSGKLVEKYDVLSPSATAGGGEYPTQDGFGWTNGVLTALKAQEEFTPAAPP